MLFTIRLKRLSLCLLATMLCSMPVLAQTDDQNDAQPSAQPASKSTQVDINTANEAQLSQLSQVGKKKAQEIIRHRELNGPFKTVDDLVKVKGIGQNTLEKNRGRLLAGQ